MTSSNSAPPATSRAPGPTVDISMRIAASPEIVYRYLSEPDRMALWLGPVVSMDARVGGKIQILMSGKHSGSGEILEIVANRRLAYTWGWDEPNHPIPSGSTRIEVDLTPDGDGTIVRLQHLGLPADAVADHNAGHSYFLERLAIAATGGELTPTSCDCPACTSAS